MSEGAVRPVFRRLATIDRAGRLLGLKRSRVLELIQSGDLLALKIRGRTLVTYESLCRFAQRQRDRSENDRRVRMPPLRAA